MKILIGGGSGFIGSFLVDFLEKEGHQVSTLTRHKPLKEGQYFWDPNEGEIALPEEGEWDAVVNLAGENIASGRWSHEKKKKILISRLSSVETLAEGIKKLKRPPKIFINASAAGYYGREAHHPCTEDSQKGAGFLAEVSEKWEELVIEAFKEVPIRVIRLRIGVVLSQTGGFLGKIIPLFKMGLGGVVGSGEQIMSWIAIEDLVSIISFLLQKENVEGAVNAVTPNPVTNREFTKTLGRALGRPTFFKVPAWAVKLLLGEMGEELALSSCNAVPEKLLKEGYIFQYPFLEDRLEEIRPLA